MAIVLQLSGKSLQVEEGMMPLIQQSPLPPKGKLQRITITQKPYQGRGVASKTEFLKTRDSGLNTNKTHSQSGVGLSALVNAAWYQHCLAGAYLFLWAIYLGMCFTGALVLSPNPGLM